MPPVGRGNYAPAGRRVNVAALPRPHGLSPAVRPACYRGRPRGDDRAFDMRKFLLAAVLAAFGAGAQAQTAYPSRPITLVVPYPAGGTADLLCRFAAERAGGLLGQLG